MQPRNESASIRSRPWPVPASSWSAPCSPWQREGAVRARPPFLPAAAGGRPARPQRPSPGSLETSRGVDRLDHEQASPCFPQVSTLQPLAQGGCGARSIPSPAGSCGRQRQGGRGVCGRRRPLQRRGTTRRGARPHLADTLHCCSARRLAWLLLAAEGCLLRATGRVAYPSAPRRSPMATAAIGREAAHRWRT